MLRDSRDRRILALAVPALGTLAIEPLYVLVDTAVVGRLGTAPLGGLAIALTVLSSLVYLSNFLTTGTTARVAFLTGRGDDRAAAAVVPQALWLAAGIGAVLAVGVPLIARPVATLLGGRGDVLEAATTYLQISAFSLPMVLVAFVGNGYHRGRSDTRTPLKVVLLANTFNVVLEVLFVYGFDWGVAGSAWSTVIAQTVAGAWFLVLLARAIAPHDTRLKPMRAEIRRLSRTARQIAIRTASLLATLTLATAVAARMGVATLAGHQISYQVWILLALGVDALAVAAQALIGTALGQGRVDDARASAARVLRLGVLVGAALTVLVVGLAPWLPQLFTDDPLVIDRARLGLVMVGLTQVPAAIAFVFDGVLEGASDFGFLQWALLGALVCFAPMLAVVYRLDLGIVGLWAAILVWLVARGVVLGLRFRGSGWTAPAHS